MAKGFKIDDILGDQSKVHSPAGQKMDIVMLPIENIEPNPANVIYDVGDVGMLQADIAEHGLRTPLEVTPAGDKYMLVAGHRRWTACKALHAEGDARFGALPCVIRRYGSEDEELVALITSNATARELTDGERLRQYVALKGALTRLKAAGKVEGRVRDELTRRTGEGAGTLGRLNAIAAHCTPEVQDMLERGEITLTRAYECSKLYKVQQATYAKAGYALMPRLSDAQTDEVMDWLVRVGLADYLKDRDYVSRDQWNYCDTAGDFALPPCVIQLRSGETVKLEKRDRTVACAVIDPKDPKEHLAEKTIYLSQLFFPAKKIYTNKAALEKFKEKKKSAKDKEAARQAELEHWNEAAFAELGRFDEWQKVAEAKALGLVFRAWQLADGGRLVVGVDTFTRRDGGKGLPYDYYICARFDADGQRVPRHSGQPNADFYKRWQHGVGLTQILAEELKKRWNQ